MMLLTLQPSMCVLGTGRSLLVYPFTLSGGCQTTRSRSRFARGRGSGLASYYTVSAGARAGSTYGESMRRAGMDFAHTGVSRYAVSSKLICNKKLSRGHPSEISPRRPERQRGMGSGGRRGGKGGGRGGGGYVANRKTETSRGSTRA